MRILHTLPEAARESIIASLSPEEQRHYGVHSARSRGDLVGAQRGTLPTGDVARIPDSDWTQPLPPGSDASPDVTRRLPPHQQGNL